MRSTTVPETRPSGHPDAASWQAYLDAADELDAQYMPTEPGLTAGRVQMILALIATGGMATAGLKAIGFLQNGVW